MRSRLGWAIAVAVAVLILLPGVASAGDSSVTHVAGTPPAGLLALREAVLDGASDTDYGCAVAISGDTALVGAERGDILHGVVYVYRRQGTSWVAQGELTASDGSYGDLFGCSIAFSGDTAVIGARWASVGATYYGGAAYVFTRSGTTWTEQAKLVPPDPESEAAFGAAVALSGDTAVVGTPNHHVDGQAWAGGAYVFTRSGTAWSLQAEIPDPAPVSSDTFGSAVALSGDELLIGAPGRSVDGAGGTGRVFAYHRTGSEWAQTQELGDPTWASGERFGCSVAFSGDTAVIGAPYKSSATMASCGAAEVFSRTAAGWSWSAELLASDGFISDDFGASVALDDDVAVIGSYRRSSAGQLRAGAAYVFSGSGSAWAEKTLLTPEVPVRDTYWGWSVGISQGHVIAGGYNREDTLPKSHGVLGHVEIDALAASSSVWPPIVANAPSQPAMLECRTGIWSGDLLPVFTYQWLRDGDAIDGADDALYSLQEADKGRLLSCRVTAPNTVGPATATSEALRIPLAPAPVVGPGLSGDPYVGRTLTCDPGTWDGAPAPALTYRWLRDGVRISGATAQRYRVTAEDQGHSVSCRVTASNSAGAASASTSSISIAYKPRIVRVSPLVARRGTVVTVTGRYFGIGGSRCSITVGSTVVKRLVSWDKTRIRFVLPRVGAGARMVKVHTETGTSNGVRINRR